MKCFYTVRSNKVEEKIELEIVVTNRSINDLELACMMPEAFESGLQTLDPTLQVQKYMLN